MFEDETILILMFYVKNGRYCSRLDLHEKIIIKNNWTWAFEDRLGRIINLFFLYKKKIVKIF